MFWVGLFIAFLGGLLSIGLSRDWVKLSYPVVTDYHLDFVALFVLLSGLTISGFVYYQDEHTIQVLKEKTEPRSITSEQRIALSKELKSAPKGEVSVFGDFTNSEALSYAKQIESLLKEAGFEIKEYTLSGNTPFSMGIGTFLIVHDGKHPPSHAGALKKAFSRAGIKLRGREDPLIASVSNRIVIWVGQKL